MSNKLKIYACSGIGDNTTGKKIADVEYFTDNTNATTNTQAVNSLLSRINYNNALLHAVSTTNAEAIELCNEIDLYIICLNYIRDYSHDNAKLRAAGVAIGNMLADGAFYCNSLQDDVREAHLTELDNLIRVEFGSGNASHNAEFEQWWKENVMDLNKVYLSESQAVQVDNALDQAVSGIGAVYDGWQNDKELSKLLTKGSEFFLYLYFTDEQLNKLPKIYRDKKWKQQDVYQHCKDKFVGIYGSEADLQRIITSGIIQYFGAKPSEICARIVASPRKNGIGVVGIDDAIIAIITAVVSIVVAILGVIAAAINKEAAKYEAITQETIDEGCPDGEDFDGFEAQQTAQQKKKKNMITIAAVAVGAYFLLNN
ncbi:MAG: hypothetical protein J6Q19_04905 [Bacteroidaceae bacterium]|nr:hypothetical protein [Bacteroidaceae bacterium]